MRVVLLGVALLLNLLAAASPLIENASSLLQVGQTAIDLNFTGSTSVKFRWTADADKYGVLRATSMYMSGIFALYELGVQDWNGFQGSTTYSFKHYEDTTIEIVPLKELGGFPTSKRWPIVVAIFRIMVAMDNIPAYTGGVSIALINDEPEVSITFRRTTLSGQAAKNERVEEIESRAMPEAWNSSTLLPIQAVDAINVSNPPIRDAMTLQGAEKFYVDWYGEAILPPLVFMAIALALMHFAQPDKESIVEPYDSTGILHLVIKQYYGPNPPPEFADRKLKVKDALRGLRGIARTCLKLSKFQEVIMVIERTKGEPIGVFNMSKPLVRNNGFVETF